MPRSKNLGSAGLDSDTIKWCIWMVQGEIKTLTTDAKQGRKEFVRSGSSDSALEAINSAYAADVLQDLISIIKSTSAGRAV